jgi:hypothetical protein
MAIVLYCIVADWNLCMRSIAKKRTTVAQNTHTRSDTDDLGNQPKTRENKAALRSGILLITVSIVKRGHAPNYASLDMGSSPLFDSPARHDW